MNKLFLLPVLPVMVCLYSCKRDSANAAMADKKICVTDSMEHMIRIDTAFLSNVTDEVKLSGEVNFDDNRMVKVFPFSSGQVQKVFVSLGDKVTKGQTLAIIKSADVAGNYSDLLSAKTDKSIAKKQLENISLLYSKGIASEREYTEAKDNYKKAIAAEDKIKGQITINGNGQTQPNGTYVVIAPTNGYVVEKNIQEGSFIRTDNAQNLFTIGDIDNVWIWANVYETDVAKVKEGYSAMVTTLAYPGKVFSGKIDRVSQVLDPQAKVMKVRIAIVNNRHELKPEMFANITVRNKELLQEVTIPAAAVITENGKNFVVIYHGKCSLELRPVNIIKTVDGNTYVQDGIKPGEKIIAQQQILYYRALLGEF